jgi:glycine cleavage system pyridoxal-binding protein P
MFKDLIKSVIPESVLQKRRRRIAEREQNKFAEKSVSETFSEIYEKKRLGGTAGEFFSGEGSNEKYAARYAETVKKFIAENDIKKVVDLGAAISVSLRSLFPISFITRAAMSCRI